MGGWMGGVGGRRVDRWVGVGGWTGKLKERREGGREGGTMPDIKVHVH